MPDPVVDPERERRIREQEQSAKMLIRRDLELTRANERLRELDKLKSEFITVAAHQLRTPLSGIKWTLSMIMNGDMGPIATEQHAYLLKAYESNERVIKLLRDLLLADQLEAGRLTTTAIPIQMNDLLDTLLLEVRPNPAVKNISFSIQYSKEPLSLVMADPKNLRIAFENLLENAVKYTRAGGTIAVTVTANPQNVEVAIADSGIGIPATAQKNVFSRFYRAPNAVREVTDGSGLGLFIVRSIIERHRGKIWFVSEENKGTTFYVSLPTITQPQPLS